MTLVRRRYTLPNADNTRRPADGVVIWTPTERRIIAGTPEEVVLPVGFTKALTDGYLVADVAPTGTTWVWRVDEKINGLPTRTSYVVVPNVSEINFSELAIADLGSLNPKAMPVQIWYAYTDGLAAEAEAAKDAAALSAVSSGLSADAAEATRLMNETVVKASEDAAALSATASEASKVISVQAKDAALGSKNAAKVSEDNALASELVARDKATAAGTSAFNAGNSAAAALGHKNDAADSAAQAASRNAQALIDAQNIADDADATAIALISTADGHRIAAANSASNAAGSAAAASGSASTAAGWADTATIAKNNAETFKMGAEAARDVATDKAAEANLNATGFSIGTVTTVSPTTPASAAVTGVAPDRKLDLVIPKGNTGVTPAISVGTVTTGLPQANPGPAGNGGPTGPIGPSGDMVSVTGPANASGTVTIAIGDLPTTRNWTLTGNITVILPTPTNAKSGTITLVITQDATGNRVITWPANTILKWPDGISQQPAVAANSLSIIHLMWTGYIWIGLLGGKSFA